jgi:hypothetical protein
VEPPPTATPPERSDLSGLHAFSWFSILDWALRKGDLSGATRAQRQLRRLGYAVRPLWKWWHRGRDKKASHAP